MKLLLHICCGPCTTYPLPVLRDAGIEVQGYFYNPNIHPFREFKKRMDGVRMLAEQEKLPVEYEQEYGLCEYLRRVVFHEHRRCQICYRMRLEQTAIKAREKGLEAFSTTLLYSRYQNHAAIRALGREMEEKYQIAFYYADFREGWQEGIDRSIDMDLYRQAYCGCIYSEQERYDRQLRQKKKKQGECENNCDR